ncbi:hypothetical protein ABEF93_004061 [Exophiala dermatitidis]
MSSSSGPRMRTKTFTGCWTCRKRKVKCDEARPNCQQCLKKGLPCAGYTTRLQWLAPETIVDVPLGAQLPTAYRSTGMSSRRHIFCDGPSKVLCDWEIDLYLDKLDEECPTVGEDTVSHGPFAVFHQASSRDALQDGGYSHTWVTVHSHTDLEFNIQTPTPSPALTPSFHARTFAEDVNTLASDTRATISLTSGSFYEAATAGSPIIAMPLSSEAPETLGVTESPEHEESIQTPPDLVRQVPLGRSFLPANFERLLHHYIHHVVDLMTVIPTPEGPWKSVHLPRALQGTAELKFLGKTSHTCNALFHALLTISAYNLAANYTITGQDLQAQKWRELALRLKARSLTFLRAGLRPESPKFERGKYKEGLAAMLSMVTIDVCSGETRTSEWHLKGLESFIQASQQKEKNHYSPTTRSLHRVYMYLRVMRESTDLRCSEIDEITDSFRGDKSWLSEPPFSLDTTKAADNWLQATPDDSHVDMSACEFVYGIPLQLLALLAKASDLIRQKKAFSRRHPNSMMPHDLSVLCDDLESKILEWPIERMIADLRKLPIHETSHHLIEQQTRAFHQAIIVYFSQLVRSVHRRHLQPYVKNIIDHLETIEVIKHGANVVTGCVLWPGFIGAAEAVEVEVQSRYLQWFKATRFYGLGAYEKACEVVVQVWEMQKSDPGQPSCSWSTLVDSNDIRLMLT